MFVAMYVLLWFSKGFKYFHFYLLANSICGNTTSGHQRNIDNGESYQEASANSIIFDPSSQWPGKIVSFIKMFQSSSTIPRWDINIYHETYNGWQNYQEQKGIVSSLT